MSTGANKELATDDGSEELSSLEQAVLDEYARLASNLQNVSRKIKIMKSSSSLSPIFVNLHGVFISMSISVLSEGFRPQSETVRRISS